MLMRIIVNEETLEVSESTSLSFLIKSFGSEDFRGWAVAINEKVISKNNFETTFLSEGDRVLFIQATQGG